MTSFGFTAQIASQLIFFHPELQWAPCGVLETP